MSFTARFKKRFYFVAAGYFRFFANRAFQRWSPRVIAVTGSVNQKGQIQPIGGVNEKIEGFFQICKLRGLTGEHGVMIPIQNVNNLQLSDEIVEAVKNKKFHIYSVSTIEEGIEVLTGVPAGKKDKDGKFPAGTVNYKVYEKLKKYAKINEK